MKIFKLIYFTGIIALAIACKNHNIVDVVDNPFCETPNHLGEFLLSNESIESGLIYESYNKVYFQNDNNDTLAFEINNSDSLFYQNKIYTYNCTLDSTIQLSGSYGSNSKTLELKNLNQNLSSEIGNLRLSITTILHLDNPELELFGDFLFLMEISLQTLNPPINYIMELPIDLRTYPVQVPELDGFDLIEEVVQNGIIYTDVFSSNEMSDSDLKIQMTKTDGIISLEESTGVIWYLIGYE